MVDLISCIKPNYIAALYNVIIYSPTVYVKASSALGLGIDEIAKLAAFTCDGP
jgi:hypothetical protein